MRDGRNIEDVWDEEDAAWEAEHGDDHDDGLVPCPYCRAEMLEDSPRCPSCGNYISEEDRPRTNRRLWILATVVICLILVLMWLVER